MHKQRWLYGRLTCKPAHCVYLVLYRPCCSHHAESIRAGTHLFRQRQVVAAQDITSIEKRLYQGRPSAIQVDWTSNGDSHSDLFTRFPFRDDALRHMLALWHRGEQQLAQCPGT